MTVISKTGAISDQRKYTIQEAGIRLKYGKLVAGVKGIQNDGMYALLNSGVLQSVKIGGRRYITEQQIRNYESAIATGAIDGWNIRR